MLIKIKVMLDKQKVKNFRNDFQTAVAQLEKQYGVQISLGTIRFDQNELRAKMTAQVGEPGQKVQKDDFQIGDVVGINHKKVSPNDEFKIIKINNKNIKVQAINVGDGRIGGLINVSPSLLVKK
jgi:hypothetical protein